MPAKPTPGAIEAPNLTEEGQSKIIQVLWMLYDIEDLEDDIGDVVAPLDDLDEMRRTMDIQLPEFQKDLVKAVDRFMNLAKDLAKWANQYELRLRQGGFLTSQVLSKASRRKGFLL